MRVVSQKERGQKVGLGLVKTETSPCWWHRTGGPKAAHHESRNSFSHDDSTQRRSFFSGGSIQAIATSATSALVRWVWAIRQARRWLKASASFGVNPGARGTWLSLRRAWGTRNAMECVGNDLLHPSSRFPVDRASLQSPEVSPCSIRASPTQLRFQ